mmetsp:Transcript_18083/g.44374  ORF Transcript_18083/g.44374 Transcript_18083/m.44374 type:complete len:336 (-) Transcript_18083:233-1240(-)
MEFPWCDEASAVSVVPALESTVAKDATPLSCCSSGQWADDNTPRAPLRIHHVLQDLHDLCQVLRVVCSPQLLIVVGVTLRGCEALFPLLLAGTATARRVWDDLAPVEGIVDVRDKRIEVVLFGEVGHLAPGAVLVKPHALKGGRRRVTQLARQLRAEAAVLGVDGLVDDTLTIAFVIQKPQGLVRLVDLDEIVDECLHAARVGHKHDVGADDVVGVLGPPIASGPRSVQHDEAGHRAQLGLDVLCQQQNQALHPAACVVAVTAATPLPLDVQVQFASSPLEDELVEEADVGGEQCYVEQGSCVGVRDIPLDGLVPRAAAFVWCPIVAGSFEGVAC